MSFAVTSRISKLPSLVSSSTRRLRLLTKRKTNRSKHKPQATAPTNIPMLFPPPDVCLGLFSSARIPPLTLSSEEEGTDVGELLGRKLGDDGSLDGDTVGIPEGDAEGDADGSGVGDTDGLEVGVLEGEPEGAANGAADGWGVSTEYSKLVNSGYTF